MPIFSRGPSEEYGESLRRQKDAADKRARKQRDQYNKELNKENRAGGRPKASERKPNAKDEEDIQHLRGWLLGGGKGKPNVNPQTKEEKRIADRAQRTRDRQDAARTRSQQRKEAQQASAQQKREAAKDLARTNKDVARTKDANIKAYDPKDRGKGRRIENERARLAKKHGQGSKQVANYNKKNPPPTPKKKGFWG